MNTNPETFNVYRTNHYELYVDDLDSIRLNITKTDYTIDDVSNVTVTAAVLLTTKNYSIVKSLEPGTMHHIRLKLYSPDASQNDDIVSQDMCLVSKSINLMYDTCKLLEMNLTFKTVVNALYKKCLTRIKNA